MDSIERMRSFNRSFEGDTKKAYQAMQAWYKNKKPRNGLFCSSEAVMDCSPDIARMMMQMIGRSASLDSLRSDEMDKAMQAQFGLHLFGTWRNSLGIYKIDIDVFEELISSPIPADTPSHIFSRLPDWCVYIDLSETSDKLTMGQLGGVRLLGFWALLDTKPDVYKHTNATTRSPDILVLNIIPNILLEENKQKTNYLPVQMVLSESLSVAEALNKLADIESNMCNVLNIEDSPTDRVAHQKLLLTLLPILLWLCAEEPDITNIKGEVVEGSAIRAPKYAVNKKTGAFIPPSQPTTYHLGKRLGGEIRKFNSRIKDSDSRLPSRKRPHIRRGHWHGVWRGTGQNKHFHLNWRSAVFVNANVN